MPLPKTIQAAGRKYRRTKFHDLTVWEYREGAATWRIIPGSADANQLFGAVGAEAEYALTSRAILKIPMRVCWCFEHAALLLRTDRFERQGDWVIASNGTALALFEDGDNIDRMRAERQEDGQWRWDRSWGWGRNGPMAPSEAPEGGEVRNFLALLDCPDEAGIATNLADVPRQAAPEKAGYMALAAKIAAEGKPVSREEMTQLLSQIA